MGEAGAPCAGLELVQFAFFHEKQRLLFPQINQTLQVSRCTARSPCFPEHRSLDTDQTKLVGTDLTNVSQLDESACVDHND